MREKAGKMVDDVRNKIGKRGWKCFNEDRWSVGESCLSILNKDGIWECGDRLLVIDKNDLLKNNSIWK